jgi:hypothetical protein
MQGGLEIEEISISLIPFCMGVFNIVFPCFTSYYMRIVVVHCWTKIRRPIRKKRAGDMKNPV